MRNKNLKKVLGLGVSSLMAISSFNLAVFAGVDNESESDEAESYSSDAESFYSDSEIESDEAESFNSDNEIESDEAENANFKREIKTDDQSNSKKLNIDEDVEEINGKEINLDNSIDLINKVGKTELNYIKELDEIYEEAKGSEDLRLKNFYQEKMRIKELGNIKRNILQKNGMLGNFGYVIINEKTFPDPIFRECIISILNEARRKKFIERAECKAIKESKDVKAAKENAERMFDEGDGGVFTKKIEDGNKVRSSELEEIKKISIGNCHNLTEKKIETLAGIELFENLEELNFKDNRFETITVGEIDVNRCKKLRKLVCDNIYLQKITGLKNLTNLEEIRCSSNKHIGTIDVSGCENLKKLVCERNERIVEIKNLAYLTNLEELYFVNNSQYLERIDVSECTSLRKLVCDEYSLPNIIGAEDLTNLKELSYNNNNFVTIIDVSKFKSLSKLYCNNNCFLEIRGLENLTNLEELDCCKNNRLRIIDVSRCEKLRKLNCFKNKDLEEIRGLENLTNLEELDCHENYLKTMDVSRCKKLRKLNCNTNQLEEIKGLENIKELEELEFKSNNLKRIYINGYRNLKKFDCHGNDNFQKIIIENCPLLKMENIFFSEKYGIVRNNDGYIIEIDKIRITRENFEDPNFRNCVIEIINKNNPGLKVNENCLIRKELLEKVTSINIANKNIKDLKGIKHFKNLKALDCSNNNIETLDLSKYTKLQILTCNNNNLETINVSGCTSLQIIECNNNNLKTLDVSGCTNLGFIDVHDNDNLREIIAIDCPAIIMCDPNCKIIRDEK